MASQKRMKLSEFYRYLDSVRRQVEACYGEVEEVQFEFNEIFRRELAAWQAQFADAFPRVLALRDELPAPFAEALRRQEAAEKERLRGEMGELEQKIAANEKRMDALLAGAQEAAEGLRKANPELDQREEHLKSLIQQYEEEYAQAYERLDRIDTFPIGWLTRMGEIGRLRRVQRRAKKQQAEAVEKLRAVREDWVKRMDKAGETQAELRGEWQRLSVETAQLKADLDQKKSSFDVLAEQAAAQNLLENLGEAPSGLPDPLQESIPELVRLNGVRKGYEQGLASVAEALGLLKGIAEGLSRFGKSVGTVVQEQRRHSLKDVPVVLNGGGQSSPLAINALWPTLAAKVKDEKHLGRHPLEFSKLVRNELTRRLNEEAVQGYFDHMGEALNQATAAWN